jgi:hypothetical protein
MFYLKDQDLVCVIYEISHLILKLFSYPEMKTPE